MGWNYNATTKTWYATDYNDLNITTANNMLVYGQPWQPSDTTQFNQNMWNQHKLNPVSTVQMPQSQIMQFGYGKGVEISDFNVSSLVGTSTTLPDGSYTKNYIIAAGIAKRSDFNVSSTLYTPGFNIADGGPTAAYVHGSVSFSIGGGTRFEVKDGKFVKLSAEIRAFDDNFNFESKNVPSWLNKGPVMWMFGPDEDIPEGAVVLLQYRGAGRIEVDIDNCFLAGTMISMWPLDVQPDANGNYDEKEVLAKVWKKPIEDITPNDWVLSFDKENKLKPGKVTRTFQNEAKIILDFHGTFVTPGHVYYREDSKKANKFEPLIDILRADGIIRHQDGTLIRATTGCEVGSKDDEQFWAFTVDQVDGGERVRDKKQLRLGTRYMLPNGQHFSMRDYMKGIGVELIEEGEFKGYVRHKKSGQITIFAWVLSDVLPNPEDFVLQRSQTSLEGIYRAGEWESMRPHMPAPVVMDSGPVQALGNSDYEQMPRNMPLAYKNETPSSALLPNRQNQPTMNRQQRRAMERKQRKTERSQGKIVH